MQLSVLASAAARSNLKLTPLIALFALAASVVVVRILAPSDFALYAVALSLRGTAQFLADLGTGVASTRAFAEFQAQGSGRAARQAYVRLAGLRGLVMLGLAATLIATPNALEFLLNLHENERFFLVYAALIGAAEIAAGLGFYALTGLFRHSTLNRIVLVQNLLQPSLVILAAVLGMGLPGILAGVLAGSLVKAVGLNFAAWGYVRRLPTLPSGADFGTRNYARLAASSGTGKLASWAHSRQAVSVIALGALPRVEVALFAVAYDFVHQVLLALTTPFYNLMLPAFSSAGEARQRALFGTAVRVVVLAVLPMAAVLLAVFSPLATLLFGSRYEDAVGYAVILVPLLAIELGMLGPATALMLARDDLIKPFTTVRLVTAAFGAVYLFVGALGLLVITAVMMTVRVVSAVALHLILHSRAGVPLAFGWWARALIAAGVAAGLGVATTEVGLTPALQVATGAGVATGTFAALVRPLRLLTPGDASILASIVPRIRGVMEWFAGAESQPRSGSSRAT